MQKPAFAFHAAVGIISSEFQRDYGHYLPSDPIVRAASTRPELLRAGAITTGEELVPLSQLKRTAFYQDFARRHDYVGGLTAIISRTGTGGSAINVCRRESHPFSDTDLKLMRVLLPHLQRAMNVHSRLVEAAVREHTFCETLDQLTTGTVLVGPMSLVIWTNRAARHLIDAHDGLAIDRGLLRAATPTESHALHRLVAEASSARRPQRVHRRVRLRLAALRANARFKSSRARS